MATQQDAEGERQVSILENEDDLKAGVHVETMWNSLSSEEAYFVNNFPEAKRKKLLWKLDLRLIPMLALLYLMSYLDRANIGNAKIEGLMDDLDMDGTQYNIALSLFFVPYVLLEVPSNSLLIMFKRPSTYLGIIVTIWGAVMTLTGLVRGFGDLVACRVLLGVFEAGFYPAAVYLISQWYVPGETQLRIALFYSSSALSGAFSGLLAFAIAKMDGLAGVEGWRWIFIIEGIASTLVGVMTFFFLVDTPALSGKWLDADEIRYLQLRQEALRGNSTKAREAEKARKWEIAKSVVMDWQVYLQVLIYWSNSAPNYGMKFTMPQIIKNMGFSSSTAQLMTVPPYVIGAISAFVSSRFADRLQWRMPFIVAAQSVLIIAFVVLFTLSGKLDNARNVGGCYFAVILACAGQYSIAPGNNAWTVENLAGPTKKAQGIAFVVALGNAGGVMGSNIYLEREKPTYPTGFGTSFGIAGLGIIAALTLEYFYRKLNKERDEMSEEEVRAKYTDEELDRMGDRSPLFRYAL